MNKVKAIKKIKRKVSRALPCPFCGSVPEFDVRCDDMHSNHGSIGHYAVRKPCCPQTGMGQTELFFCNDWKEPDYLLWWKMANRLIDNWNLRT